MRYLNLQHGAFLSLLFAAAVASAACSEDTSPRPPGTTAGSGGATTGSGGSTAGSAGSTTTTSSGGSGGAGTGGAGTGGAGTGGAAGTGGTGTGGAAGTGGTGGGGTGGGGTAGTGTGGTGTGGAAGAAGTGGSAGTGGAPDSGVSSVCSGTGTRILTLANARVDDFEDAVLSPAWSTFNDVLPTPHVFKMIKEAAGAIGTGNFGHYAGTGAKTPATGGFGVGATYNMAIDKVAGIYCVDISAFDGVTFWARAATAGSKVTVNFVVPETNAAPDGDCASGCFLHPLKEITLTAQWAQHSVTFAEALPISGTARVQNRLQIIGWLSPDSNWDFSVDEIRLYKGIPPTGPVRGDGG